MIALTDSTPPTQLAAAVHAFVEEHLPAAWLAAARADDWVTVTRLREDPDGSSEWWERLGAAGLATPTWPVEYGGLGVSADTAQVVKEALATYDAGRGDVDFISIALAGPTILAHGTPEQKERHLKAIALGKERWCQLFSEPGAGSDLAGLSTRAERQPDGGWLVNGQKVWSSYAHLADFGILMARSDPSLPKHRGITYFLCDMRAPGVEPRPLRQMNGDAEFNEVFLTDVLLPDSARVGEVGAGWAIGIATLMNERSGLSGRPGVGPGRADALLRRAQETGAWESPVVQDDLLALVVRERANQMMTVRAFAESGDAAPTAEGSVRKLANSTLLEDLATYGPEVEPYGGTAWSGELPQVTYDFLDMKKLSIAGGTSEIQRNIIGERLLGLPKDPDPEKDLPFEDRTRS
jgi:alkylation response protein AidB-like acyl-CoA dehydrogenase